MERILVVNFLAHYIFGSRQMTATRCVALLVLNFTPVNSNIVSGVNGCPQAAYGSRNISRGGQV